MKFGTAAFCRSVPTFYHCHTFSLRAQYLQQLIQTDRHGEDKSRRFSTSCGERVGNEFITVVMFVITVYIITMYSKLRSFGRTAVASDTNTVRGELTETQMSCRFHDVIGNENL